jgi:hypothetical protein
MKRNERSLAYYTVIIFATDSGTHPYPIPGFHADPFLDFDNPDEHADPKFASCSYKLIVVKETEWL